jgi:serine/threonine protein phosphatase PrpC
VDGDGFCSHCGFECVLPARDHVETALSPSLAGVSDRGKHHPRNEDFVALAAQAGGEALVVCDGVSTSPDAAAAAETAARAACDALQQGLRAGAGDGRAILQAALAKAQAAVAAMPYQATVEVDPPESTIVAALRRGRTIMVGWLGDSRAYLITPHGSWPLTHDHSWVNAVVDAGEMTRAQALHSPHVHAITRTLGGRTRPDEPSFADCTAPQEPGYLILCSDGLWNYADEAAELAALVGRQPTEADALTLARSLVDYARGRGGHDNITVAVLRL